MTEQPSLEKNGQYTSSDWQWVAFGVAILLAALVVVVVLVRAAIRAIRAPQLAVTLSSDLHVLRPYLPLTDGMFKWVDSHIVAVSFAVLACLMVLFWMLFARFRGLASFVTEQGIEEIFSSDAPVTRAEDDRLGQQNLVQQLSRFLQKANTSPPLVIALQARWGMGKSSVMRMLESELKRDKAAVTVWFNAWHHQREDQLLAYLLETIQKEAIPPWLSAVGLWFRIDLLRIRMFANRDRLAVFLSSVGILAFRFSRPDLFHLSPTDNHWQKWIVQAALAGILIPLLQIVIPFKSNPEKLAKDSSGSLITTLKELVRLPSLVGKSDVRQEFAGNLKDVVEALSPQRLVIFLDDLDRCKPDQVVQILEAINFLSSAAPCIIIVGADYEKVETLAGIQFEAIATSEAENLGTPVDSDRVELRLKYARSYLRKIVNLRLNLRLPNAADFAQMLCGIPVKPPPVSRVLGRAKAFLVVFVSPVLVVVIGSVLWSWYTRIFASPIILDLRAKLREPVMRIGYSQDPSKRPILITILALGIVISLIITYRLSRPRQMERVQDAQSFKQALRTRSQEIYVRCKSPREVRRFLNYLRLIASEPDYNPLELRDRLRSKFPSRFDADLVMLATGAYLDPSTEIEPAIRTYYLDQCSLFGLNPESFVPLESTWRVPPVEASAPLTESQALDS